MSRIGTIAAAAPDVSLVACAHCVAPLAPGQDRFCCAGCEGAHDLVAGLGLDLYYRRREGAAGALRPVDPPALSLAARCEQPRAGEQRIDLILGGLSCGACVWLVEQALGAESDVIAARVSLTARRLTLRWRGAAERADDFARLLARLGFRVAPWSPACLRVAEDAEGRRLLIALGIATFGSMNVMLVSVAVWFGTDMGEATRSLMHWLAMLIALPVVAVAGMPFYRPAFAALRHGRMTMDLAVSLGVLAATAMSVSEVLRNGPFTWFDGATALLALLLGGRVLNHAGRRRAMQAGAELLAWQQGSVSRITPDGAVETIPLEAAQIGDRVLVASGERLGLDTVLESGTALLDTSAVTGESLPRNFLAGEAIPAGALNMGAPFVAKVSACLADGSLAQMTRLLEQAEHAKSRITGLADRAARVYVPVAHGLALATFLGWWIWGGEGWQPALVYAVAVLIITCPCGLAIAVPAVQVVAAGALFRRGVLLGRPDALERLAGVDHVVLDKTGTLTEGQARLLPGAWSEAALRQAAGIAAASRHPLARALHRARPDAPLASGVREVPGEGLACGDVRLGRASFAGVAAPDAGMALWLSTPGAAPVEFRFADGLREDAAAALDGLRKLRLGTEILSGDAEPAVSTAARTLGIAQWRAAADPVAKADHVRALQNAGRRVLMIGDGANDALALATAHASACPAGGTHLARSTADLVLRAEGLAPVVQAIAIARRAQRIARQNVGASLAYNAIAVPMAMAGAVTPLVAAAVMASSSLIVILNALRAGRASWTP